MRPVRTFVRLWAILVLLQLCVVVTAAMMFANITTGTFNQLILGISLGIAPLEVFVACRYGPSQWTIRNVALSLVLMIGQVIASWIVGAVTVLVNPLRVPQSLQGFGDVTP